MLYTPHQSDTPPSFTIQFLPHTSKYCLSDSLQLDHFPTSSRNGSKRNLHSKYAPNTHLLPKHPTLSPNSLSNAIGAMNWLVITLGSGFMCYPPVFRYVGQKELYCIMHLKSLKYVFQLDNIPPL